MRVLITGINGFVGKHLSAYLRSKGFDIIGLDITAGTDIQGDISNRNFVFNELSKQNFDAVIHLAALADIKKTTEDPYSTYTVNCFGTLNLLELSSRKNVERFLYASSANVYGVPADRPATEATPFNPRLPYDYSKVVSETLVRSLLYSQETQDLRLQGAGYCSANGSRRQERFQDLFVRALRAKKSRSTILVRT